MWIVLCGFGSLFGAAQLLLLWQWGFSVKQIAAVVLLQAAANICWQAGRAERRGEPFTHLSEKQRITRNHH